MIYRVSRFQVHQTAKVVGILYAILALIFAPLVYLLSRLEPAEAMPIWIIVVGPILYGALGYVFTALALWLYNLVAGWTGGVAFTLTPSDAPAGTAAP